MATRSNALLIMKLKRFITFNLLRFFTGFNIYRGTVANSLKSFYKWKE